MPLESFSTQPDDFASLIDAVECSYDNGDTADVTVFELTCAAKEFGLASLIAAFDSVCSVSSEAS